MDPYLDIELNGASQPTDQTFSWENISANVKDRTTGEPKPILSEASGIVHAGEMLAIMGPSGSGKTTMLNILANRLAALGAVVTGDIRVNGQEATTKAMRNLSAYVEQEDPLIGSLTVRETIDIALRLALPRDIVRKEAFSRIDSLIDSFGLRAREHTIVGTPVRKGLSGGQIKRLGVASALVTDPRILFLDEPTSGLDSTLSYEVMKYIKYVGEKHQLIIIASIHQPSSMTFQLFDKLHLLSSGRTCYFGPVAYAPVYFDRIGFSVPAFTNPAEFFLNLINVDLDQDGSIEAQVQYISHKWTDEPEGRMLLQEIQDIKSMMREDTDVGSPRPSFLTVLSTLVHRSWIKAYRDVVVYGVRVAMYLGLAILMGTVFLRLGNSQENIQPFINAIFFGGAFMSFMAVAYVPAFLEDLGTYQKERANGYVGPFVFLLANFIIGLPFLFCIALLFSIVAYWMVGFRADGSAFMMWVLWLFLDLLAAESLVVLVSSIIPIFVVALAITAFVNGLWMCVGGFLVPFNVLNVFWKNTFHYIDYQAYVFQGMMVNEMKARTYTCGQLPDGSPSCLYPGPLSGEGKIDGDSVLKALGIGRGKEGQWLGIMVAIIASYRIAAYLVLRLKKN